MSSSTLLDQAWQLLREGQLGAAEDTCRKLVAANPRDANAWIILGSVLKAEARLEDAEAAYRRAVGVAPNNATAHHNLGALYAQLDRAEEALAALDRAQALGLRARALLINRGRALMLLYRFEESERAYAQAVAADPSDPLAQVNLAQLRYMRGDPAFARDLIQAATAHPTLFLLHLALADVLRKAGDLMGAERTLRNVLSRHGPIPEFRGALSSILHEAGHLKEAQIEAQAAVMAQPQNPALIETFVSIQLSLGKPEPARPLIATQRQRKPLDQRWIAYEATAARMMSDPIHAELNDYARLVRTYDLSAPPGWASMNELNAAVLKALTLRHQFECRPLEQSLRNGIQTARSLKTDSDPAIQALLQAFNAPLADYCNGLDVDQRHPLSASPGGQPAIAGAWSVQLRREGFHVNHIHPEGWISSAYYVSVPTETHDENLKSGWLKFGEPRFTAPGCGPEHFIKPLAGRLVLFPSYLWHGTNAIHGSEPRVSVAFDAVRTISRNTS